RWAERRTVGQRCWCCGGPSKQFWSRLARVMSMALRALLPWCSVAMRRRRRGSKASSGTRSAACRL
ncbi:unnamed protein product, partial [Effrenium voratum]